METPSSAFPSVAAPTDATVFQILRRTPQTRPTPSPSPSPSAAPPNPPPAEKRKPRAGSYESLGLNAPLCASLHAAGYSFPTPIQRKAIPPILAGADVVAMARTGSGKTAAFLAPLLHRLAVAPPAASAARRNGPRALVVSPTRELALQTLRFARLYSKHAPLRAAVVVGGTPLHAHFETLAVCPPLLIATPGRLLQLLAEMRARRALTLATARTLVLDEADRLFEGTLAVETAALLAHLRDAATEAIAPPQTILVSATMPHALAEFSRTNLRPNLHVVRLDVDKSLPPTLASAFLLTRADVEKDAALQCLLRRLSAHDRSVVIFAATHRRVDYLTTLLRTTLSTTVVCVHGSLDHAARLDAVSRFRKASARILVVTDVAARGIDLPSLDVVINYDTPPTPKLFVHRVGRVARAGRFGMAFTLVASDELPFMLDIFLFIGCGVTFANTDTPTDADAFASQAYAVESSFVLGALPKGLVDEEVELTRKAVQCVELTKLHASARNAHKLYTKTRGTASGESVRRAKLLFETEEGGRRRLNVHPWFAGMESSAERQASQHAAQLSVWRPKECMVVAPTSLIKRKRRRTERNVGSSANGSDGGARVVDDAATDEKTQSAIRSLEKISESGGMDVPEVKKSARQLAMEEERKRFFLPLGQESHLQQTEKALRVTNGGKMGDDLQAYRELRDAAVDLNADSNADLLRSKHTGGNSGKYWDRVSKKFVKGGATHATSKRNLHVASREAKARARAGESYSTEDGALFKKWLSKNQKAVEQLAERMDSGEQSADLAHLGLRNGLGSNDFRKGAFGRRARIAAAARNKERFLAETNQGRNTKPELKTAEEIKKARKLKAKADARRQAHLNKKNGKSTAKKQQPMARPQRGSSKSKMIIRRK